MVQQNTSLLGRPKVFLEESWKFVLEEFWLDWKRFFRQAVTMLGPCVSLSRTAAEPLHSWMADTRNPFSFLTFCGSAIFLQVYEQGLDSAL